MVGIPKDGRNPKGWEESQIMGGIPNNGMNLKVWKESFTMGRNLNDGRDPTRQEQSRRMEDISKG